MYLGVAGVFIAVSHLRPVGNAAPPRPTSPEAFTSARISSFVMVVSALTKAAQLHDVAHLVAEVRHVLQRRDAVHALLADHPERPVRPVLAALDDRLHEL